MHRGRATSWGLAFAAAGTTFAVSYALQRLGAVWSGEPPWTDVVYQAHIPYYWRCGLAALHAAVVATTVGLGVSGETATTLLRWAPLWVPLLVLPLALLMVALP